MRIILTLFLWMITSLMPSSSYGQPFNATEMLSAKEVARSYVIRRAERMQESEKSEWEAFRSFALSKDRLAKMANATLGDPFLVYDICVDEIGKLMQIDDIYTSATFKWVEYPVLIDDELTLTVAVKPTVDSTTKELAWRMLLFGGRPNGLGNRIVTLSERFPEAQGYQMMQLVLCGAVADFVIIKRGSDYRVFPGFRDIKFRAWPDYKAEFDHAMTAQEFMGLLKSYSDSVRSRGGGGF